MTDENEGTGDGECGKLILWIGTPHGCGGGGSHETYVAGDDSGAVDKAIPAESTAASISEIAGAEDAGKADRLPNPGNPNCGRAGRPSSADSRAPWSASWWLMAVI